MVSHYNLPVLRIISFPSVVIECPVLGNPPNGMVVLSGRTVGSIANYSCLPTLTLTGVMIRECQNTGQWSDQAPSCESEL